MRRLRRRNLTPPTFAKATAGKASFAKVTAGKASFAKATAGKAGPSPGPERGALSYHCFESHAFGIMYLLESWSAIIVIDVIGETRETDIQENDTDQ
jgi:hypothetical protein